MAGKIVKSSWFVIEASELSFRNPRNELWSIYVNDFVHASLDFGGAQQNEVICKEDWGLGRISSKANK